MYLSHDEIENATTFKRYTAQTYGNYYVELFRVDADDFGYCFFWRVTDKRVVVPANGEKQMRPWHCERWGKWYTLQGEETSQQYEPFRRINPNMPMAFYERAIAPSLAALLSAIGA
jgi:hypothetical protein